MLAVTIEGLFVLHGYYKTLITNSPFKWLLSFKNNLSALHYGFLSLRRGLVDRSALIVNFLG